MDYEKVYKNARQAAKHALDCEKEGLITTDRVLIERMFPELKESEDEKIRKFLIHVFENNEEVPCGEFNNKKIISWLEKQGVSIDVDSILNKVGIKSAYKDGKAWCILFGDNIQDGICGFGYTKEEAFIKFLKELLEKQGEQKEKVIDFKASDWHVSKVDGKIHNMCYVDKVEQKSKETIKSAQESEDEKVRKALIELFSATTKKDFRDIPTEKIIAWLEKQNEQKSKEEIKTTAYGTFGKYGAVEYVYILDYSTGRVIVAKHNIDESISELFEQLGLKESQCHYMVSSDILSIEYINF